jgi:hypothetical protein
MHLGNHPVHVPVPLPGLGLDLRAPDQDVVTDRRVRRLVEAVVLCEALMDPPGRGFCLRGAVRSSRSIASIQALAGSRTVARGPGFFLGGGTAEFRA